jgi:hypothetical protein
MGLLAVARVGAPAPRKQGSRERASVAEAQGETMTRKLAFGVMAGWLAAFSSLSQEPRKTSVAIYPLKAAGAVKDGVRTLL